MKQANQVSTLLLAIVTNFFLKTLPPQKRKVSKTLVLVCEELQLLRLTKTQKSSPFLVKEALSH